MIEHWIDSWRNYKFYYEKLEISSSWVILWNSIDQLKCFLGNGDSDVRVLVERPPLSLFTFCKVKQSLRTESALGHIILFLGYDGKGFMKIKSSK